MTPCWPPQNGAKQGGFLSFKPFQNEVLFWDSVLGGSEPYRGRSWSDSKKKHAPTGSQKMTSQAPSTLDLGFILDDSYPLWTGGRDKIFNPTPKQSKTYMNPQVMSANLFDGWIDFGGILGSPGWTSCMCVRQVEMHNCMCVQQVEMHSCCVGVRVHVCMCAYVCVCAYPDSIKS